MTQFRISQLINNSSPRFQGEVKELEGLLRDIQPQHHPKIISFSQRIDNLDPLDFLATISPTKQLYFYWENPRQSEAIIAYGTIRCLKLNSADRFRRSQQFINNCLTETLTIGDLQLPGSGPHFFCSFSFFEQQQKGAQFPSATIFLPEIQIYSQKNSTVLVINTLAKNLNKINLIISKTKAKINRKVANNQENPNTYLNIEDKEREFKQSVNSALKSIEQKKFSKIVLAHAIDLTATQPFNLIKSLQNLRQQHPDCYLFSTSNGEDIHFIGASPERLLTINNKQLITDALAGSAPRGKTVEEDQQISELLLNNEKERREHQAVREFIQQRLRQLGLEPKIMPRELLKLANIQHLWTAIYAEIPPRLHPLDIVAQLHPTPAVAGVPTETACQEIRRYESFDRSLYAAPIGWLDYQGNSKFIVGIRSALIQGNQARLYGGAGIVAGSTPDKEYAEVQLKLQSLLKTLV